MDAALDSAAAAFGAPPLLVVMLYPIFVHFMYALIWNKPSVWFTSSAPATRVRLFGTLAYSKQAVFFSLLPWYMATPGVAAVGRDVSYLWRLVAIVLAQQPPVVLAGLVALGSGLFLEGMAFKAIGETAIMYGCKLGAEVEWVEGVFPYTLTSHPQHIGIALVYTSMLALLGLECWPVVVAWHSLYGFQTVVEGWTAQDEHDSIKAKAKGT